MNQKKLNYGKLAGLFGGGVVGAAIGWVIAEVLVYQLYEKEVEYYDELAGDLGYAQESYEEPIVMKKTVSTRNDDEKRVTNYAEQFKKGKLNTRKVEHEEVMDADEEIIEEAEPEDEVDDGRPSVVSEEEWSKADDGWESITLSYYAEDRVFTDEHDIIIPNAETLVGHHAVDNFGEESNDPDTVFIKNVDEQKYYEIIRVHGSYDEIVLGMPKKTPKKKIKKIVEDEEYLERKRAEKKLRAQQKAKLNDDDSTDETI
jgi:hypothetical protein